MVVDRQPNLRSRRVLQMAGRFRSATRALGQPTSFDDLKWFGREDAPLLFRPRAELAQWLGFALPLECLPSRTRRQHDSAFALALYSHEQLRQLRAIRASTTF